MADVAELGFAIDSAPLQEAKSSLTEMASAAGTAEKATRNLAQYAQSAMQTVANENANAAESIKAVQSSYESTANAAAKAAEEAQKSGNEATNAGRIIVASNDNAAASTERLATAFTGLWGVITRVATLLASYFTLQTFIKETAGSEESMARLNATLSATGGISGQTSASLSKLSEETARFTTFSKNAVQSAEAIMLSFTRVGGETFPRAIQASADLAARMGTDIPDAARLIGRALQEPARGMLALQRAGIVLTDTQREQVKHFAALNDVAGAQGVILKAIEGNSAGAAAAMRATLGGALSALRNQFMDAFQVSAEASTPLRNAIEALNKAMSAEGFRQFVNLIGMVFFTGAQLALQGLTLLVNAASDLMDHLESLAPAITAIGVVLAAVFGPAAVGMVFTFVQTVAGALAALVIANPVGLIVAGLAAAGASLFIFRDQIKEAIGVDVVDVFRTVFNFIVNGSQFAFEAGRTLWNQLPDIFGDIGVRSANAIIDGLNSMLEGWNNILTTIGQGFERMKSWVTGWVETWKQGFRDIVDGIVSIIPEGMRNFLGITGGAGGGAAGGGQRSLESAVPSPSAPPGVSTSDFGTRQAQRLDNPFAARIAASNEALASTQQTIMNQDPAGALTKMVSNALSGLKKTAEDAKGAITGVVPALGNMATGANAAGKAAQDAFSKTVQYANEFIAKQQTAAQAVNLTGVAASTLVFETELLNRATRENAVVTEAQKNQIHDLAVKMAEAKNAADVAKFMKSAADETEKFIGNEQMLQRAVFQSAQSAQQARIEFDLLNKAKQQGIALGPSEIAAIQQSAAAMAEAAQRTRDLQAFGDMAKSSFTSFFTDFAQGLQQGKSLWESFGQAALNSLNNITNKLIEMAANQLWNAAFGGSGGGGGGLFGGGGGGGGLFGGILSFLGGGGGGSSPITVGAGMLSGTGGLYAEGGDYPAGRPRIVGEKGPELDIPRLPGTVLNAAQLAALAGSGQSDRVMIQQTNHFGSDVTTATMSRWAAIVEERAKQGAIAGVARKRSRGGQFKQVFEK